jgi:RNA polymerase sigma-70 factor (ECF subfamily)
MNEMDRLAQLVMQRCNGLTLYARQWLDFASAQDAVQDALVALFAERVAPDDPVAWMYRAVRNASIDRARARSRRRRREQTVARDRGEWFDATPNAMIEAEAAQQALAKLEPQQREIVVLRIWGEMTLAQIASIVQLSVSSVHERYTAALEQMRSALEKPCDTK